MILIDSIRQLRGLFEENKEEITKYNVGFFPKVALVGGAVTVIAFLGSFFYEILEQGRTVYGLACIGCLFYYRFFRCFSLINQNVS